MPADANTTNQQQTSPTSLSSESVEAILSNSYDLFHHTHQYPNQAPVKVTDQLNRKEELENDNFSQDIKLKRLTLIVLFVFLGVETVVVFVFTFLQATYMLNFKLEEWTFRLILSVTISQIYLMIRMAVEYLFPNNNPQQQQEENDLAKANLNISSPAQNNNNIVSTGE